MRSGTRSTSGPWLAVFCSRARTSSRSRPAPEPSWPSGGFLP
uniref:Uncharacterized protein n=1 Tax=Macrostomum lignano TaxID=282301 RepID=A0A1I8G6Y5_9PLAT